MNEQPWTLQPELSRREALLGLLYIPFHTLGLPQLAAALAYAHPGFTVAMANGLIYGVGTVFLALVFGRRLFYHYNRWVDNAGTVLMTFCYGIMLFYALNFVVGWLLQRLGVDIHANPNNQSIFALEGMDYRVTRAMALFLAPLLEETLFRGVLFGVLRPRHRLAAYAANFVLFAALHLWQFIGSGPELWLYALQYLPVTIALCWAYEKTGCLWTPILLHMFNNILAYNQMG